MSPNGKRLTSQIEDIGADPFAFNMWEKGVSLPVRISGVPSGTANIIKQEALASGIDAAVCRGSVTCSVEATDVIILGSVRGLKLLIPRLKRQGFSLPLLASELEKLLKQEPAGILDMRGRALALDTPRVMGIMNVTPDSFSDGGLYTSPLAQEARLRAIFEEGGLVADIGAVSTRPGHTVPPVEDELERLLPAVKTAVRIAAEYGGFVSADTWRYGVAKAALELGADMINDQSGLADTRIAELCAEFQAGVCIMHNEDAAGDLMQSVKIFFQNKTEQAVKAGIGRERIIIDPGFGFKKSLKENYLLLKYLKELCSLDYPLLVGISRKSMIGGATGRPAAERGAGTLAAETAAILNGAKIIRTHEVGRCCEAVKIAEAMR